MVYWTIYLQFPFYFYPIFSQKKIAVLVTDSTTVVQRRAADRHLPFDGRFTISSRYRWVIPCQLNQNSELFPVHVFFFCILRNHAKFYSCTHLALFHTKSFKEIKINLQSRYIIKCAFLALRLNSTRSVAPNFLCRTKSLLDVIEIH